MEQHKHFNTIEEYLSFVRHELKGKLAVIKEGFSQVLEEYEKNKAVAEGDVELLQIGLESADKMNAIINELIKADHFRKFMAAK